ncbi:D-alanyl-D-alanine dipeptidase [Sneathiella chinensis]|uniref:D-alanyl-D-alanine dipeptidase n=1 Tax=Sneathiella chinensis TaxID=349750 RepID=A0ABQ5U058_9PROT|nr:D-alanyl-D-alanine dipeptidase [Sneathiella chinensis]GLQ05213.1 D-alanyl-D-alanine dipeptidase [Sneathiella chinensis]
MNLVEISPGDFDVELDIRYASDNNFTGAPVYGRAACFLNEEAAELLAEAIRLAAAQGYRLRLFDGFRPTEAVQKLWDHTPNPDYLAPPSSGSPHARGAAIDLTLLDEQGQELDMGTGFDDMTVLSHHGVTDISAEAQKNRAILLGIMTAAGWDFYRNEWWHYQLFRPRRYPTLSDQAAGTRMMDPEEFQS